MPTLAAIYITHTHERIARSVMSMGAQTRRPDHVVVACDGDDPRIATEVARAARLIDRPVLLITRPHAGKARPAQTRNNAVRALLADGSITRDDRLVFFDGDCMAPPGALGVHDEALDHRPLCLGWRADLTEAQTATLTDGGVLNWEGVPPLDADQLVRIDHAARTYRRRLFQRHLSITKAHKPQVLGANFGVRAWAYLAINGMDETFVGWGMEDDDVGRRLYAMGVRPTLRLRECVVLHQHHPSRSAGVWSANECAHRIAMPFSTGCRHGLANPLPQTAPTVRRIDPRAESQPEPKPESQPGGVPQRSIA